MQNYDTAKLGVQDATGGLGAIKGVIDGGAFIELEREDSQSTEFLLGPGVPDAIQNLVNSAASRPFLTCDQVNMIDIFIDNGITFPPITPPGLRASVCN